MQYDPKKGGMRRPTRQPDAEDDVWADVGRKRTPEPRPAQTAASPRSASGTQRGKRPESGRQPASVPQTDLYDDFNTFYDHRRSPRPGPQKKRHTAGWTVLFIFCLLAESALALWVVPQLTGVSLPFLPQTAFAGGEVITPASSAMERLEQTRAALSTDRIFSGVSIDGVDVGGMTVSDARAAVEAVQPSGGGSFDVTVESAGQTWHISSETTPVERDTERALRLAYAAGRSLTWGNFDAVPVQQRRADQQALRSSPLRLTTSLTFDEDSVRSQCAAIASAVSRDPVDAAVTGFDFTGYRFTVSKDSDGCVLDAGSLYAAVVAGIRSGGTGTVKMEPETVHAEVTRDELTKHLGKLSTYTTTTTSNANRNTNIRLSAEAINGRIVDAGDTFSFNAATGQRTAAKGYKEANAISGGTSSPEIGGGVCQTSSTLFNAVARANLEIVARSPHAWPSSYVAEGMDATVNWPGLDFQFRNSTDWPVAIVAYYSSKKVTVTLYGYMLDDGVTIDLVSTKIQTLKAPEGINYVLNEDLPKGTRQTTVSARSGSVWETYRVYYLNGKETSRELLCTSTYKAYQETIEYND